MFVFTVMSTNLTSHLPLLGSAERAHQMLTRITLSQNQKNVKPATVYISLETTSKLCVLAFLTPAELRYPPSNPPNLLGFCDKELHYPTR